MEFKHLKDVDYTDKSFSLEEDFVWSYFSCRCMPADAFKNFAYNIENIANHLTANNKLSRTKKNHVMCICLSSLEYCSEKIQDFDTFVNFVCEQYTDCLHQYQEEFLEKQINGWRACTDPSEMAKKATTNIVKKIVTKE